MEKRITKIEEDGVRLNEKLDKILAVYKVLDESREKFLKEGAPMLLAYLEQLMGEKNYPVISLLKNVNFHLNQLAVDLRKIKIDDEELAEDRRKIKMDEELAEELEELDHESSES